MAHKGLSHSERIRGKTTFENIFTNGKVVLSADKLLRAFYLPVQRPAPFSIAIAAAVSKKSGNAVWRNRMKRLIKEAYRLNKNTFLQDFPANGNPVQVVFTLYSVNSRSHNHVGLADIQPAVVSVMERILKNLRH